MKEVKQPTVSNDYALAKALNNEVLAIIMLVYMADAVELPEDHEIAELNRAYILLVHELQKLYERNHELEAVRPEPIWKRFDVLKTSTWDINEYLRETDDFGHAHNARVEKLCIIAGADAPEYSPEQKKLVDSAKLVISKYAKIIDKANVEYRAKKENDWQIASYTITYKPDGTILINDVLRLKKAHAGSATERLLEQAVKSPYKLFKPDLGQTSRTLSTVLSSAGFSSTLRQLFFPTVSRSRGVVFRPTISREQADNDNIDTTELDIKLKALGADTQPKT